MAARREALVIGAFSRSRTSRETISAGKTLLPEVKEDVGEIRWLCSVHEVRCVVARSGDSLMSRVSSLSKEKPRPARLVVVARYAQVHQDEVRAALVYSLRKVPNQELTSNVRSANGASLSRAIARID